MHSAVFRSLAAVAAMTLAIPACTSKTNTADARLQAIYTAEWNWREQQFPDNEDAQKPIQDHLPKVDTQAQTMRLNTWEDVLQKLDSIPRAELSAAERINYDVYRPQIEVLIANQRFRDYEMPANSDSTFWTDLGYTARRPYRSLQDYRNWIAQMGDIPRYFREQMQQMRQGLRRGFTPPRVTLAGRDASITAVTDTTPEASLFYTPFKDMPGVPQAEQDSSSRAGGKHHPRVRAALIPRAPSVHAQRISARRPHHARRLRSAGRQGLLPGQDPRVHDARSGPGCHSRSSAKRKSRACMGRCSRP